MSGGKTIESYVADIMLNLENLDYESLNDIYETLRRMKNSGKLKHELNYWKVLQCLGEMAGDLFLKSLRKCEKISCVSHFLQSMQALLQLFTEMLTNVAIIKRVIVNKNYIVPILFAAVYQTENLGLFWKGFVGLYRFLIVGKCEIVEMYMKHNILRELYSRIKSQQGNHETYSVILVGYCAKMLLGLIELGDMKTRNIIRRSHAKQAVIDYVVKVRKESKHEFVLELISCFQQIKNLLDDENEAQMAVQKWNPKVKLKEDLEQGKSDVEYLFCSSPSCRKQCTYTDHFQYCGACRLTRYCSQTCQKEHWKSGHKLKCLKDPPVILDRGCCGSRSCHRR